MATAITTNTRVQVAIVDDDENLRLCFKDILDAAERFRFAGGFPNAAEALIAIPKLQPHLVVMDIRLPDLNGIECARQLKQAMPRLRIIMVTGTHEPTCVGDSLDAGATSYLLKPIVADQLLATLSFAADTHAPPGKSRIQSPATMTADGRPPLSPREKEVLAGLAEGLLYKEISQKLGISYAAVHKYQHNIFKKLRVTNRSEAIRIFFGQSQ
jgi:DNA-binding NarL/FixJ family response regulator